MMQLGNTKYTCDHPHCKSVVILADPDDIKNSRTALAQRGWTWLEHNEKKPDEHFCQTHGKPTVKDED